MALRIPFLTKRKVAEIKKPIPTSRSRTINEIVSRSQFDRMYHAEYDFERTTKPEIKRKLRGVMPETAKIVNKLVLESKGDAIKFYAAFDRLPTSTKEAILKYLSSTSRTY